MQHIQNVIQLTQYIMERMWISACECILMDLLPNVAIPECANYCCLRVDFHCAHSGVMGSQCLSVGGVQGGGK